MTAFWDITPCDLEVHRRFREEYITLIMEAILTSETSVYFDYITRRYIPEGCSLLLISLYS